MKRQSGQAIVVVALSFLVLISMVGLVIDSGSALLTRRQLQNAVDAAALAGTQYLAQHRVANYPLADQAATISAAKASMVANGVSDAITVTPVKGTLTPTTWSDPLVTGISVTVSKQHSTYFLKAVGIPTFKVDATATAAYVPGQYECADTTCPPLAINAFDKGHSWVVCDAANHRANTCQGTWAYIPPPVGDSSAQGAAFLMGKGYQTPLLAIGTTYPTMPQGNQSVSAMADGNATIAIFVGQPSDSTVTIVKFWNVTVAVDSNTKAVTLTFVSEVGGIRLTK